MTTFLSNHEAERLLLDIRIGREAATAEPADRRGAFLAFPTSVVVAVPGGRGASVFPLRTTAEPGVVCYDDGWSSVTGQVDGVSVEGGFGWAMDDNGSAIGDKGRVETLARATYRFRSHGRRVPRPVWADQLPRSQRLPSAGAASLRRQRARLVRRGYASECELLRRTERVFEQCCRGPLGRAIAVRPALDVSDVVQRGMQVAGRLLALYSSAARPPCSWLGMIQLDGRRDLHRAITQLDWLPRDLTEVLARIDIAAGVAADDEPTVVLAAIIEAAVTNRQPIPRASPGQIRSALTAPQLVAFDPRSEAVVGTALSTQDRRLEAADDRPGELTAAVGRLIGAEPGLVVRASLGDYLAIDRIGQGVIAALRLPGETNTGTRQRFRHEFQTAGRLFTSADGLVRFGHQAPPLHLAQLDANLAELAGRLAS